MHNREVVGLPVGPIVFVAVATGNVVANLPPLFALYRGGDGLIWMTSEQAKGRGGLLARSKAAVAVRFPDLRQQEIHKLPDFPQFWEGPKEGELSLKIGQSTPVLIGNGGTKPMQDGLRSALRRIAGIEPAMVYGELRPAGFVVQSAGGEGKAVRYSYDLRRSIGLDELLAASGHVPHWVRGSREARRLWPGPMPEAYGVEPGETLNIHRSAHDRATLRRVAETEVPAFADAGFDDEAKEGLRRCPACQSRAAANGSDGALAGIYNNFRKAGQRASKITSKQFGELTSPVDDKLGNLFHRSVEQRVVAFLNDLHHAEIASRVSEVWTDFDIHRLDQCDEPSPESAANFDVFILLVNGVALHRVQVVAGRRGEQRKVQQGPDLPRAQAAASHEYRRPDDRLRATLHPRRVGGLVPGNRRRYRAEAARRVRIRPVHWPAGNLSGLARAAGSRTIRSQL